MLTGAGGGHQIVGLLIPVHNSDFIVEAHIETDLEEGGRVVDVADCPLAYRCSLEIRAVAFATFWYRLPAQYFGGWRRSGWRQLPLGAVLPHLGMFPRALGRRAASRFRLRAHAWTALPEDQRHSSVSDGHRHSDRPPLPRRRS